MSSPKSAQAFHLLQDDMQRPEHPGDAAHARPEILDLPLRQPPRAWLACKDKTPCDLLMIGLDLATAHAWLQDRRLQEAPGLRFACAYKLLRTSCTLSASVVFVSFCMIIPH